MKKIIDMMDKIVGAYLVEVLSAETIEKRKHAEEKALSYMQLQKNLNK